MQLPSGIALLIGKTNSRVGLNHACDEIAGCVLPPCRVPGAGAIHATSLSVGTKRTLRKTWLLRSVQMSVPLSRRNGSVHAEVPKLNGRLLVCCRLVSRSQLEFSLEAESETQGELSCYIQQNGVHEMVHSMMNPHVYKEARRSAEKLRS